MRLLDRIGWQGENLLFGLHLSAQEESVSLILAKKTKGQLRIVEAKQYQTIAEALPHLRAGIGIPIVLLLSPQVAVEGFLSEGVNDPVTHLLGVGVDNRADFATQSFGDFHAVVRQAELQDLLAELGDLQERVIRLFFSPVLASFLLPAMDRYEAERSYELRIAEEEYSWQNGLMSTDTALESIDLEDLAFRLNLSSWQVLPYSALVYHHLQTNSSLQGQPQFVLQRKQQQQFHLWTRIVGFASLAMLMLLLGGTAWQYYAQWQIEQNEQLVASNQKMLNTIADRAEQIEQQYSFVSGAAKSTLKPTTVSEWLDQMMTKVPKEMYLRSFVLSPEEERLKKIDPDLVAEAPDLLIEGETTNAQALAAVPQDWEGLSFVAETRMWEAKYDYEYQMQRFTLLVWFQDE